MPAAGGRQRDSLRVLPVFCAKVKAEVLMQRFLKLCRRGRIGRKSPALDTGSGAATLLTVASLPLLLLTLSSSEHLYGVTTVYRLYLLIGTLHL